MMEERRGGRRDDNETGEGIGRRGEEEEDG